MGAKRLSGVIGAGGAGLGAGRRGAGGGGAVRIRRRYERGRSIPVQRAAFSLGGAQGADAPDGKSAYVANFYDNKISHYSIDQSTGVLTPKSPATVATGSTPDAVAITPDGKSAYVSNFYDNKISQYSIDQSTGVLSGCL